MISVVIPCYNSERSLPIVYERLCTLFGERPFELVLVNDGSADGTWKVIAGIAAKDKRVKAIELFRNFGQHSAIMAGYSHATGDLVVLMDDDLQNRPEVITELEAKINEGYDFVYAAPKNRAAHQFRSIGSRINDVMAEWLIKKPKSLTLSSFLIVRGSVIRELCRYAGPYPYIGGLLLRITRNGTNIFVDGDKRAFGKSGYSFMKLLRLWLNGFTAFSIVPLRFFALTGVILSVLGLIFGLVIVIQRLYSTNPVSGWTSLQATLIFFSGVQLISLGMIGEYVGRIYMSINNTPQYAIRTKLNVDDVSKG